MDQNVLSIDLQLLELKSQHGHSPAEMRTQIESILASAENLNYPHGIAEAKLYLAQLFWADMSFNHASSIIQQAIQFAKVDGENYLLTEAYHLSALIYVAKGRYTHALSQWLKCLKLMQSVQHPTLEIDIMIGLGNLWAINQQHEKSLLELSRAYDQAQWIQSPTHAAKAAICLSRERLRLGHFDEALASLEQGTRHLKTLNNPTWLAEICNYRARTWLALGNTVRALKECQIAWQTINNQEHLVWAQCLTLITLAQVDLASLNSPLEHLNRAHDLAERYQLHSFQSQIALTRSQYAEQQADWDEALASFKQYRLLDLGELTQHQQQGAREFSSVQFLRLAQQIDALRQTRNVVVRPTKSTTYLPHNHLPRSLWLQQLTKKLSENSNLGVIFIRLPLNNQFFSWQRKLYLMATICSENSQFCRYADGLFAILTPQIAADELNRQQINIENILKLLPFEANGNPVAATLSQAGETWVNLLSRIESQLYLAKN